jgi:hypothetical protein
VAGLAARVGQLLEALDPAGSCHEQQGKLQQGRRQRRAARGGPGGAEVALGAVGGSGSGAGGSERFGAQAEVLQLPTSMTTQAGQPIEVSIHSLGAGALREQVGQPTMGRQHAVLS